MDITQMKCQYWKGLDMALTLLYLLLEMECLLCTLLAPL